MKKIVFPLFLALLVTGCSAKYPEKAHLELKIAPQETRVYPDGASASIHGRDARTTPEVLVYQIKNKHVIRLSNESDPRILITERLASGIQEQGLLLQNDSNVRIELILEELVVRVTRPNVLYTAEARCRIQLAVKNSAATLLTRTYTKEATQDSMGRPDPPELEKMLNEQLSDIISQILKDDKIPTSILGQPPRTV